MAPIAADSTIARITGAIVPDTMQSGTRTVKLVEDSEEILFFMAGGLTGPFDVSPHRVRTEIDDLNGTDLSTVDEEWGFNDMVDGPPRVSIRTVVTENRFDLLFISWFTIHHQQTILGRIKTTSIPPVMLGQKCVEPRDDLGESMFHRISLAQELFIDSFSKQPDFVVASHKVEAILEKRRTFAPGQMDERFGRPVFPFQSLSSIALCGCEFRLANRQDCRFPRKRF